MEQATEQVSSMNAAVSALIYDGQSGGWVRRLELQRPVRPVPVVVLDVDSQDLLQVPATHDEQPVQALGPHRPDPALGVGVGVGRLHRRDQYLGAVRMEDVVEGAGELRIPIANKEAHSSAPLTQHETQVAGLLGNPGPIRVGRYAGQDGPAGSPAR